jgi:hypothetical protein
MSDAKGKAMSKSRVTLGKALSVNVHKSLCELFLYEQKTILLLTHAFGVNNFFLKTDALISIKN